MGFVLFLMAMTMLLGSWIETRLTDETSKSGIRAWAVPIVFFGTLAAIIWWAEAWPALIGMVLTIFCAVIVGLSPVVPRAVKDSPWMIHILAMVVYVSIVSNWFGCKRADAIIAGHGAHTPRLRTEAGARRNLVLIGRLGDSYTLWDPVGKTATLFPASDIRALELARKTAPVMPAKE